MLVCRTRTEWPPMPSHVARFSASPALGIQAQKMTTVSAPSGWPPSPRSFLTVMDLGYQELVCVLILITCEAFLWDHSFLVPYHALVFSLAHSFSMRWPYPSPAIANSVTKKSSSLTEDVQEWYSYRSCLVSGKA